MKIVHTHGRKSLPLLPDGEWVKAEPSQGVSNCAACRLAGGRSVQMGDTQNPDAVVLVFPAREWGAFLGLTA
ncbi:DUF397 domain-containing protein [Nocardiopsis aegyptia]|uniref:DUF397 domain-containing protein n=1 Tax=Nocardiopsis aegyptia TaxID=220378 RepID=A0A7Z0EKA6_9ACTN|nr:DUF397 domain-containing protein [Nocardiopsis aegyptia]NYJ32848.1 hypothetical protein [Nocardiopsis aegyptia]